MTLDSYPIAFLRPRLRRPYAWVGHIPFAYVLVDMLRPRRIVELGTDSGNSYLALCQAVAHLGLDTKCTAIDCWQGDAHAGAYGDDVYRTLRAYHDPRYGEFSVLMRSWFDDAVHAFEDGSIDLLHIDGLHTYEAVSNDFNTWLPKLSERAVVLFHDSEVTERDFGVDRFVQELSGQYPIFRFRHSNGLAVAQIGRRCDPAVEDFFALCNADPNRIRAYFEAIAAGMFVSSKDTFPSVSEDEPNVVCKLYYRQEEQGFDENRALSFALNLLPQNDEALCTFTLPDGIRPDIVRIDPSSFPGVYTLRRILAETGDGLHSVSIECAQSRLLSHNGGTLPIDGTEQFRLVCFDDDPWFEIHLRDVFIKFPEAESWSLSFDLFYEAVLFDSGMQAAVKLQDAALIELRKGMQSASNIDRLEAAMHTCFAEALGSGEHSRDMLIGHVKHVYRDLADDMALLHTAINARFIEAASELRRDLRLDVLLQHQERTAGELLVRVTEVEAQIAGQQKHTASELVGRLTEIETQLAGQQQHFTSLLLALMEQTRRRTWTEKLRKRVRLILNRDLR